MLGLPLGEALSLLCKPTGSLRGDLGPSCRTTCKYLG
jgi:hypothetical protein